MKNLTKNEINLVNGGFNPCLCFNSPDGPIDFSFDFDAATAEACRDLCCKKKGFKNWSAVTFDREGSCDSDGKDNDYSISEKMLLRLGLSADIATS